MHFTDEDIEIRPGYCARTWQSCDYFAKGQHLFHERTYNMRIPPRGLRRPHPLAVTSWMLRGEPSHAQWFAGSGTLPEIQTLALKYGGEAMEEFYPEEGVPPRYFLAFEDTEKALAFCRTEDFDRLCLTMEKV